MGNSVPMWRHLLNFVIGMILLAALVALSFQIYRVSTGKVAIYGQDKPPAEDGAVKAPKKQQPAQPKYAATEQVQQIIGAQPVDVKTLGGSDSGVTFRSQSGAIACTIAKDLAALDSKGLVPPVAAKDGEPAKGPGVVCATVHNIPLHQGDGRRCSQGTLRTSTFGVWDGGGRGIGSCLPDLAPMTRDAKANAQGGERYKLPEIGYGQHVELGSYGCIVSGAVATCANLTTGQGFTVEDNAAYVFFGPEGGAGK